jgi:hypothetical protein
MAYKQAYDQRIAGRDHYRRNAAVYKARARAHNKATETAVRLFIAKYLAHHPCIDCGEADPVVLEFDHRDRKTKRFNVCDGVRRHYSLQTMRCEIDKCDVRCANCHRRRTHQEQHYLVVESCAHQLRRGPTQRSQMLLLFADNVLGDAM